MGNKSSHLALRKRLKSFRDIDISHLSGKVRKKLNATSRVPCFWCSCAEFDWRRYKTSSKMKVVRNSSLERAIWVIKHNYSYLVQQVKDLGKYVQASSWIYRSLIKDTCLQTQHKYLLQHNPTIIISPSPEKAVCSQPYNFHSNMHPNEHLLAFSSSWTGSNLN